MRVLARHRQREVRVGGWEGNVLGVAERVEGGVSGETVLVERYKFSTL